MGFPEAVFFERLRNPDQLDGTGGAFASRKLHEERRLEFEAAFAGARGLRQGDCAEHGGGSQFPRPMKRVHELIIAKRGSARAGRGLSSASVGSLSVLCQDLQIVDSSHGFGISTTHRGGVGSVAGRKMHEKPAPRKLDAELK